MKIADSGSAALLRQNSAAHDAIANRYDRKHTEIYNPLEQRRLEGTLGELVAMSGRQEPKVLDVGSGTGNLALKFLALGCEVTAMDVSAKSLDVLRRKVANNRRLHTITLDGARFPMPAESFDIVATYSVLHHVPDYLGAVEEMIRVARPGGIVYIDHEMSPDAWADPPAPLLAEYRRLTRLGPLSHIAQLARTGELLTFDFWRCAFIKLFINRRYEREGDIHVWPDDHIEWQRIYERFEKCGAKVELERDYLCYFPRGGEEAYERCRSASNDTRMVVARRLA